MMFLPSAPRLASAPARFRRAGGALLACLALPWGACLAASPTPPARALTPLLLPLVPQAGEVSGRPGRAMGTAVAMDLDTALVGAPGGAGEPGVAYVFTHAFTGEWQQQARLSVHDPGAASDPGDSGAGASGIEEGGEFGSSVALAGETALIGTGPTGAAAAYVFVRDGSTWRREARLPVDRGAMSVALSSNADRAVVGVSGGSPLIESVHVFARQDDGGWVREALLTPPSGTPAGSGFGGAVALSDDLVAVGAQGENGGRGAVHVFQRAADGHWQRQARLALTAEPPALFGWSVALSGRTLMVGAFGENGFRGAAYLFQQGDGGRWDKLARLVPGETAGRQCFGFSVALTLYGALIGQPCAGEGGQQTTQVHLFSRDLPATGGQASGTWSRRALMSSPLKASTANFGAALATNGLDVIIGSPGEPPAGAAYVLECLPCLLYGEGP